MADMMNPMGAPPGPSGPMAGPSESVLNAGDVAKQGAMGVRPDMTIREYFQAQGLDVDRNTMVDLAKWSQSQLKNRTTEGKLGAGGPAPGPEMPPEPGGLGGLANNLGTNQGLGV